LSRAVGLSGKILLFLDVALCLACGSSTGARSAPSGDGRVSPSSKGRPPSSPAAPYFPLEETLLLFEHFGYGAADGLGEPGGKWPLAEGKDFQTMENPPGPYRSYVDAGALSEYTTEADLIPLSGTETKIIHAHADGEDYRAGSSLSPPWDESRQTRNFAAGELNLSYNQTYRARIEVSLAGDGETPLLHEDFDDGAADGFTELGGMWSAAGAELLQSASQPPGPYRWWVNTGNPTGITVQAKPLEVVLGEAVCIYGSLTDPSGIGLADRLVSIEIWSPQGGEPRIFYSTTDPNGDYVFYFRPPFAAKGWAATAFWPGDQIYDWTRTELPAVFDVLPADTQVDIALSANAILWSGTLDVFGQVRPATPVYSIFLEGGAAYLHLMDAATGERPPPVGTTTDINGNYRFRGIKLPHAGVWKVWVEFAGTEDLRPASSREMQVQAKDTAGYAIVVSGAGDNDTRLESHNRTADTIYRKLLGRGFGGESLFYLRFGVPGGNGILVDGLPGEDSLRYAITTWAKEKMRAEPGPLFIVLIGSGKKWQFYVAGEKESVTPWQLNDWVAGLENSLAGTPGANEPITLVFGTPYSGSFIHWLSRGKNPRVVVTSSDPNELPVTGPEEESLSRQGDFFVLQLFESLARGENLKRSFEMAAAATLTFTRNWSGNGLTAGLDYPDLAAHHPLLDDNRDGIGSFRFLSVRPGDDGFLSSQIFLGYGEPMPEAQIVEVSPKQIIFAGEYPDLWARVNDPNRVQAVWMIIKPPSFSMGAVAGDLWVHRDVEGIRVPLSNPQGEDVFSTTSYPAFTEKGTYSVLFFIKDRYTGQLGEIWKTKVVVFDPQAPPPGEFSILSPAEGETVGTQVLLTWSPSQKGRTDDEITYTLQIATDPSFQNVVFEQNDIEGTSFLVGEDTGLLDRTTYYWRVRAETYFGWARFALGAGMRSADIGVPLQGNTLYDRPTDTYTILGNGLGIYGTEDQLRFVHTSARGSFEVSARLDSIGRMDSSAFAGIMIRESADPDSPYAMIAIRGDDGGRLLLASRGAPGSPAYVYVYGAILPPLPVYVKLVCMRPSPGTDGDAEITPYFSTDGITWFRFAPMNLVLPDDVHVGICVASGDAKLLVKAVVSKFTISPLLGGLAPTAASAHYETTLSEGAPRAEPLTTEYSTFTTNYGAGLPGYNVLAVFVYNQNDPSQSPPGTTITISPIVGTIHNWMYTGYVPVGTYNIDVSAPNFSPEHRTTEVTTSSSATEVFTLAPYAGSVSGKVVTANTGANLRGAAVQLRITSGIYLGTTYDTVTGTDGRFSLSSLYSAVSYQVTVSKTYYNTYQAPFSLAAGEAKDLGTISLGFTDADSDGLPDPFELVIVNFDPGDAIDDITDVHPDDDFDGDGQTNANEYLAGTDPTSAPSCLRIVSIVGNTSSSFTITWTSVSGILYKMYYSDTVAGWSLAASGIAASGTGQNSWTDDDTSGTIPPPGEAATRFYRVEAY